jgi:hypothetical protein
MSASDHSLTDASFTRQLGRAIENHLEGLIAPIAVTISFVQVVGGEILADPTNPSRRPADSGSARVTRSNRLWRGEVALLGQ